MNVPLSLPTVLNETLNPLTRRYQELVLEIAESLAENHKITIQDQLDKLYEEVGEVAKAWIGARGKNPRKGFTHTEQDIVDELADVAITALVAIQMMGFDVNGVMRQQAEKSRHYMSSFYGPSEQG